MILEMKEIILAVLLFLFIVELLSGTLGVIRTIYFQESLSASDSIRTTWFTALAKNTKQISLEKYVALVVFLRLYL